MGPGMPDFPDTRGETNSNVFTHRSECTTSAAKQRVGKLRRDAEGSQTSGDGNTTTESGVSPTRGQKRKSADCGGRKTGAVKVPKIEEMLKDELGIDVTDIIKPKGVKKEEE